MEFVKFCMLCSHLELTLISNLFYFEFNCTSSGTGKKRSVVACGIKGFCVELTPSIRSYSCPTRRFDVCDQYRNKDKMCDVYREKSKLFQLCTCPDMADSPHQNAPECIKLHLKTQNFLGGMPPYPPRLLCTQLGINRLCSATFEQLLGGWATICSTSSLGQLLPSLATFEQQIDIKPNCDYHTLAVTCILKYLDYWQLFLQKPCNKSDITSIFNLKKHVYTKLVIFLFNLIVESHFKNLIIDHGESWRPIDT